MSLKDRLHHLVDTLPESEVPTAERILEALRATADPVAWALDNAPLDDEPDDDDFDGGLTEAREDVAAGRVFTMEEVKRDLGLP
jgi:hypothetical protein